MGGVSGFSWFVDCINDFGLCIFFRYY